MPAHLTTIDNAADRTAPVDLWLVGLNFGIGNAFRRIADASASWHLDIEYIWAALITILVSSATGISTGVVGVQAADQSHGLFPSGAT